ncbi:hypothetical protein WS71_01475 [Burkholderia mayonis]|uniref:Uncharacterized protein n=1 Tax=Burkholderia mayonis TaxID=1385591 RepID=A0A1B4FR48_9BURK|nr:hypothetical protein WS71_01475 [Burkholderia mayonis]KVE56794.1 hypothetical protein WS71_01780 [Burkholderia mayonis]
MRSQALAKRPRAAVATRARIDFAMLADLAVTANDWRPARVSRIHAHRSMAAFQNRNVSRRRRRRPAFGPPRPGNP